MDEDLLHSLMGGGLFGGLGGMMRMGGGNRRRRKGDNTVHPLRVTLEDLYKGRTRHLEIKKNIVCYACDGIGGKPGAVRECTTCRGTGIKVSIHQIGPGMVQQMQGQCNDCSGEGWISKKSRKKKGEVVNERDRCKNCRGKKVVEETKRMEVVVEKGMQQGRKIVFRGEGNQQPGVEPGDIIIVLDQTQHKLFQRHGDDLMITQKITLTEALCGFRMVITHLDGRHLVIKSDEGDVIEPGTVRQVPNEGMPFHQQPDQRGNLYIKFEVEFPENNFNDEERLRLLETHLPARPEFILPTGEQVEEVDMVEMDSMPSSSQRSDEDDGRGGPHMQCATH